ncbi:MAG: hypothetical protein CM1200mP31_6700 [Candidatus Neomarinimicrobiota bacterium]|nr:MAG: hypothetical protein CM1200mP31_6700 [Candidatus Neomarinimicrobiota bacterium]
MSTQNYFKQPRNIGLINQRGEINLDFADVECMRGMGDAVWVQDAKERKSCFAAQQAISSPLLEHNQLVEQKEPLLILQQMKI